ncbi:hypothetical protein BDN71DRAFT_1438656 [Pleurotus eryngii]|uniref:Uncharacterized protein n=1 Tax=Pleurotus eryngii TaxID=5323 RepID=A0A9P6AA81_PLEER|nr:hypothetical protein BDN71DRAFT_1438656 [Pleurotus eryngii]
MPPKSDSAQRKPNASSTNTKSKSVVKVGPKNVSAKYQGIKNDKGERPTTSRALTLRHGKYGSFGTGEMMHLGKMTGREKLDLLAEDLTDKAKKAVAAPFSLEKCLEIAESQCHAYLDDIRSLHHPELFYSLMHAEITARTPPSSVSPKPSTASLVISRIHNSYLLASAWRLILYSLIDLGEMGLADATSSGVKVLLKSDARIRERFLVLYDLVQILVGITQKQFATIAAVTPPYVHYFKHKKEKEGSTDPDDDMIVFDWAGLKIKDACKSFIGSIVIELCFPDGPYPTGVLFQLLHDAVEEAPHHAKRFPQALWDSVGDLAISVELLSLMEAPLLSPEASGWRNSRRPAPAVYDEFLDAQRYSLEATKDTANWRDLVSPLEKTKMPHLLESMWKTVNANYMSVSGKPLNALWQLDDALIPNPHWHAIYIPSSAIPDDEDDEDDDLPALSKQSKKKPLRLTNGEDDGSGYESMPLLLSISDDETSSDDDEGSSPSFSDVPFSDYDESDEGEYDTDAEDELREQLKEAMNQAHQYDFYESLREDERPPVVEDAEEKERKEKNSFLKLLGSLRGRMFSSGPKLKVPIGKGPSAPCEAIAEDAESAGDAASTAPKKKKKKPKKKKKKSATVAGVGDGDGGDDSGADDEEEEEAKGVAEKAKVPAASIPGPMGRSAVTAPISPPTSPSKKKKRRSSSTSAPLSPTSPTSPTSMHSQAAASTASLASSIAPTLHGSTTSLPLPQVEKAQSSHSYLKDALEKAKTKTKTRAGAGDGGLVPIDEKEGKKGFFARWRLGKDKGKDGDGVMGKENENEKEEANPFVNLSKRAKEHVRVLFKTDSPKGTLRWEQFLKIMAELNFEIDPSTAGSSVRFKPPDARDKSITFHKPHPDSTLQPHHISAFGARLRDHYGWSKEKLETSFYAPADEAGRMTGHKGVMSVEMGVEKKIKLRGWLG